MAMITAIGIPLPGLDKTGITLHRIMEIKKAIEDLNDFSCLYSNVAVSTGQALLDNGWIEHVISSNQIAFKDEYILFRPTKVRSC